MFERPDGVPVPDTETFLDIPFEHDDRIGILFGPTDWTFVGCFKPCEDTCSVECVRARKTLGRLGIQTRDGLETYGTRLIMMDATFPVYKSWTFTLSSVDRY